MRTKNLTPYLFAATPASLRPPKPAATLLVRAAFRLAPGEPVSPLTGLGAQGSLSGDQFAPDDDERRGPISRASDFAEYKPKVDVLVHAKCHTPGGKPMTECPVRFVVGPVSKSLRVTGRRVWETGILGASPGKPEPFTVMPLDFSHAFGGPGHAPNPAGKGLDTPELPNVEGPSDVIGSKSDRFPPRGFGPISPLWAERWSKVGKEYGKSYQEKRAPYHSEDFDWSFFNAAPADQQAEHLRGDEEMTFQNLHPRAALFSAKLPGVRVRAFLRDREGRGREVKMRLDTVVADLEGETLHLSWRGVEEVAESDLADVTAVLFAEEALSEEPRPATAYLEELHEFEKDPIANDPRAPKLPPPSEVMAGDGGPDDEVWSLLGPRVAGLPAPQQRSLKDALARALAQPVKGVDLRAAMVSALSGPSASPAPPVVPIAPGQKAGVSMRGALSSVQNAVRRLKAQLAGKPIDPKVAEALRQLEERVVPPPGSTGPHPVFGDADPSLGDGEPGQDEPGPGADLHGRDFAGQDLSGKDLSKANLRGANLTGAKLAGANLRGANLELAILYEADVTGADLSEANLKVAQLGKARGQGIKLVGASLDGASFQGAELPEADLSHASGRHAMFAKATLQGATFAGASLEGALFEGASLERAVFRGATLPRCRFLECKASFADFGAARLDGTSFTGSDLEKAIFAQARGKGSIWMRARLSGADLRYAVLPDAHFQEVSAAEAKLGAADLARARFYRASLVRAELIQSNLLEADLRKADLTGAKLSGSNLYAAQLLSAKSAGATFDGANVQRTLLEGGR